MAESQAKSREGLSLQTLVIAAVASGIAAIVVSHFWQNGTVFAAAMTPVVVSVLKEALQRPIESDVVRKSASKVSKVATAALPTTGGSRAGSTPSTSTLPPPPAGAPNGNGGGDPTTSRDVVMAGPRRTYSSAGRETTPRGDGLFSRLRGPRLKIAIVTGILAFAVAVAALTLPELIFGGSVTSSGGSTTIFGGSSSTKSSKSKDKSNSDSNGSQSDQQDQSTQPQNSAPDETQTTPSQPDETQTQPQQTTPPSSSAPPSSGGAAPTTPAPTPPTP
jgi:hypothetical protein